MLRSVAHGAEMPAVTIARRSSLANILLGCVVAVAGALVCATSQATAGARHRTHHVALRAFADVRTPTGYHAATVVTFDRTDDDDDAADDDARDSSDVGMAAVRVCEAAASVTDFIVATNTIPSSPGRDQIFTIRAPPNVPPYI